MTNELTSADQRDRLTVLITNIAFAFRSGTEVVVEQIARGLHQRGHRPIVFSTYTKGAMASALRLQGIAVVDRLTQVGVVPDVIHGQHNVTTVMAMTAFPECPVVFSCHDFDAPKDRAPIVPRIRRYIAVDEICRERLLHDGVPDERIAVFYNAVDLKQYQRRGPLPRSPRNVLVLTKGSQHLAAVRSAVERAGLALDGLGSGVDSVVDDLPLRLQHYDVVIATARMAKEALAAGCAVILGDHRGYAGLVTRNVVAEWRQHNFGRKVLTGTLTEDNLLEGLSHYDPADAAAVTDFIREHDGLDLQIDQLERLYREVIDEGAGVNVAEDMKALSGFLEDFLISRDFTRPWADLYRNVVEEKVDTLDQALERHSSKVQANIMARLDQLERAVEENSPKETYDNRTVAIKLRQMIRARTRLRALREQLSRLLKRCAN